jgi:hypothetical protein
VELWTRNGREILPKLVTSTSLLGSFTYRKARHGTDGFTSPPKEGVLRIFFRPKNATASAGFEPVNLGTKGQHAISRPPKPLLEKYLHIKFNDNQSSRRRDEASSRFLQFWESGQKDKKKCSSFCSSITPAIYTI